jgi:GTP-binding protein
MLIDRVEIHVRAGNGGRGAATFLRDAQTAKGGPNGGNGGRGSSIFIQGSHNLTDLQEYRFKKNILAENGEAGMKSNCHGRNAEDITLFVPIGTEVTDTATGETFEITNSDDRMILVKGGVGGRGNYLFKTSTNQAPTYYEAGAIGEDRIIKMEMKIIADIGLIGLPNAGKSSLLSVLTNATPAIGAYPFTTLEPNIGMMGTTALADIPGLIEGASTGKGLGTTFLKHIEKTRLLVHCIDSTIEDPYAAYKTVRNEYKAYSKLMLAKPEIVLLTKTDIVDPTVLKKAVSLMKRKKKTVYTVSVNDPASVTSLVEILKQYIKTNNT